MMRRGQFAGKSLMPHCARQWYLDNPKDASASPAALSFHLPEPTTRAFITAFVNGAFDTTALEKGLFLNNTVAGGGKTNDIVYTISLANERNLSVMCTMFNVEARAELLRRNVPVTMAKNFHAIYDRAYKVRASALHRAHILVHTCECHVLSPRSHKHTCEFHVLCTSPHTSTCPRTGSLPLVCSCTFARRLRRSSS